MKTIEEKFNDCQSYYRTQITKDIKYRRKQLKSLKRAIIKYENQILAALHLDLGKNKVEAYATEIGMVLKSINTARKDIHKWAKTKQVNTPLYLFPSKSYIKKEPLGTVLIIGPFNYPVQLVFEPLIGAIAAGNTAIVKPSELTPNVASVISKIIEEAFESAYVTTVEGGVEETQSLLQHRFDYIFFTGSERVGRIVYEAASRHLTPVTLELGGKSPVIIDETANLKVASERVALGKFINAGQTCVAPDYVLIHESVQDEFIKALEGTINEFYGKEPDKSPDYGRIVNARHFDRLQALIDDNQDQIVIGGQTHAPSRYIAPTIIKDVHADNPTMQEEIFGPILPLLTYQTFDEAVEFIQARKRPLSLYLFSEDENNTDRVLNELSFGGGAINDTLMQLANPNLPFGGVGASGFGKYHGKYSFYTFTHEKSYIYKTTRLESGLVFPPYKGKFSYIKNLFK
ncbi:aldehyde dehydrogenase [Staphylococcus sp. IVB6181]|uniref:aldehyde dehydrogenase n=1 Tax=Staphylococcus sp. IVB6181 TaxID=2929481 RepID=UPI0021CEF454|nr:aldehyde dehydrogenase [Staphylococcus sp. IVB6181]UXV35874.1 aldehyde dehydrogenase [Staphylococcus sp. IVB6181]